MTSHHKTKPRTCSKCGATWDLIWQLFDAQPFLCKSCAGIPAGIESGCDRDIIQAAVAELAERRRRAQ